MFKYIFKFIGIETSLKINNNVVVYNSGKAFRTIYTYPNILDNIHLEEYRSPEK
jgi:hypothetical protein